MDYNFAISDIARIIQLSVAPVFLLTGIAGILNVLSNRLGRITDRARVLEVRLIRIKNLETPIIIQSELNTLWRRARVINWGINFCTTSALLVCLLIITLFIGDMLLHEIALIIAIMFIAAMLFLVAGLICFLNEVYSATSRLRSGIESSVEEYTNTPPSA